MEHENIIELYDWTKSSKGDRLLLVLQYCSKGDLENFLEHRQDAQEPLQDWEVYRLTYEIALALYYLKAECDPPILHGDLKPLNIFIHEDGSLKLGDFGAAAQVKGKIKGNKHATQFLTQTYSSPERL